MGVLPIAIYKTAVKKILIFSVKNLQLFEDDFLIKKASSFEGLGKNLRFLGCFISAIGFFVSFLARKKEKGTIKLTIQ